MTSNYIDNPQMIYIFPINWIRYYSSLLNEVQDICANQITLNAFTNRVRKVFLLYATNSSQTMIRAKTFCTSLIGIFPLFDYIEFLELKLIASTYFGTFDQLNDGHLKIQ